MRVLPLQRLSRAGLAFVLLAPLLVVLLVGSVLAPWHSPNSLDDRTYLEMIQGISEHGLPYTTNGDAQHFPELQARWNRVQNGRLWGTLPPAFPYIVTPLYLIGGARAIVRFNVALLAVLALGVFGLGYKLTRDPMAGVVAAYVALVSAPVWTFTFDVSPYTFAITCVTYSTLLAVISLEANPRRSVVVAGASGLIGGLGVASHLLASPMLVALLAALAVTRDENLPASVPLVRELDWMRARGPTRRSLLRAAAGFAGALVPLSGMAVLNHVRFDSWNPLSYGPCVWRSCAATGLDRQGIGPMLSFVTPIALWAAVVFLAAFIVRRSRRAVVLVFAFGLGALVPASVLHDRALALTTTAWGFIVDMSGLDLREGIVRHPDGFGFFLGPWVVKSTLQCTPALVLALLARSNKPQERHALGLVIAPAVALFAALSLRANLPITMALGVPFINLRYVTPALPLLSVLAVCAVRELPWRRVHVLVGIAILVGVGLLLARSTDDNPPLRRWVLLRGSLAIAAVAFVVIARARIATNRTWRGAGAIAAMLVFAYGFGSTLAVDLRALITVRNDDDRRSEIFARELPQRFAVIGVAGGKGIDAIMYLRRTRDIEYADIGEIGPWENFRRLIDLWNADSRPIYGIFFTPPGSIWPDVRVEVIDAREGLYRFSVRPAAAPARDSTSEH